MLSSKTIFGEKKNQQFNIERTTSSPREKYGNSISNIFFAEKNLYIPILHLLFSFNIIVWKLFSNFGSVNNKNMNVVEYKERGGT